MNISVEEKAARNWLLKNRMADSTFTESNLADLSKVCAAYALHANETARIALATAPPDNDTPMIPGVFGIGDSIVDSFWWMILHGIFGWLYVVYYIWNYGIRIG